MSSGLGTVYWQHLEDMFLWRLLAVKLNLSSRLYSTGLPNLIQNQGFSLISIGVLKLCEPPFLACFIVSFIV